MSLGLAFGALIAGIVLWAVIVRQLTVKPWEVQLTAPNANVSEDVPATPAVKVGLWIFLAVITSLFGLFISAYYMRMGHGHTTVSDWSPIVEPKILWLNTVLLILSSVAMQWGRSYLLRGNARRTFDGMLIAGLLTFAFLGGQ